MRISDWTSDVCSSDLRIATTATRSGNGFRLDGKKSFVLHGHVADMSIVAAKTDGGITLFAVPKDAKGLTADPRRLVDSSLASHVTLDGVEVDADAVIGRSEEHTSDSSH